MKQFNKILFTFLFAIILFFGGNVLAIAKQNDISSYPTLKEYAVEISETNLIELKLDASNIETNIADEDDYRDVNNYDVGNSPMIIQDYDYYIIYKDGIDFFGKKLTLRLDFVPKWAPTSYSNTTTTYYSFFTIHSSDRRVEFRYNEKGSPNRYGIERQMDITYSFYDEDGNPFDFYGVVGIKDPDGSNLYFDTSRDIYYIDAESDEYEDFPTFANVYHVTDNGVERNRDVSTYDNLIPVFYNRKHSLFISTNYESSISITEMFYTREYIIMPYLYSLKFNINYVLDGGENNSDNPIEYYPGEEKNILNPTKEGYEFLGWEEGNKINKTDVGDKTFTAKWKKIEVPEEPKTYKITTEVENGTIDESKTVNEGEDLVINYKAKDGYYLAKIEIDGKEIKHSEYKEKYEFKNITEDHKIKVTYLLNPPTGSFINYISLGALVIITSVVILLIRKKHNFYKI